MLLIDRNNDPRKTVYYVSAVLFNQLETNPGVGLTELYDWIQSQDVCGPLEYELFSLALDFLFLLGKVNADEKGGLYVY